MRPLYDSAKNPAAFLCGQDKTEKLLFFAGRHHERGPVGQYAFIKPF